jgi:hypothetical protein
LLVAFCVVIVFFSFFLRSVFDASFETWSLVLGAFSAFTPDALQRSHACGAASPNGTCLSAE